MRNNKTITILSCVLTGILAACIALGVYLLIKYKVHEPAEYSIIVPDEIDVYVNDRYIVSPILIDANGKTVEANFEYASSANAVRVSNDGVISVVSVPAHSVYVTVTDTNTAASATVKVNVVEGLGAVMGLVIRDSENKRTAYTGSQTLQLTSGENVVLEVVTSGGSFEVEDYVSLSAEDASGTQKTAFDYAYNKKEVELTAIGLGSGRLRFKLTDEHNASLFFAAIDFTINMPNVGLGNDILRFAGETLLSPTEIRAMRTVAVSATQMDLAELKEFSSLQTIVFTSGVVVNCVNKSSEYDYCFKSNLLSEYVYSEAWSAYVNRLFPYDGEYEEGDAYVVLHNDEVSEDCPALSYIKVSAKAQLPVYGKTGRVVSGWKDSEDNSYTNDAVRKLAAPGIHLYAVWMDTPTEWFSYETIGGKQYIVGLTDAWKNCTDVLDKTCLYLPDSYDGENIYGIGTDAFSDNAEITRVLVPSTIEYIADGAFNRCNKFEEVLGAENVTYVGNDAFAGTIWRNAFTEVNEFLVVGKTIVKYNGSKEIAVAENDFPAKVTTVSCGAFKDCGATGGSIVIPSRIVGIYDQAFANSGLVDFTMNGNITFGKGAFAGVVMRALHVRGGEIDFTKILDASEKLTITKLTIEPKSSGVSASAQSNVTVGTVDAYKLSLTSAIFSGFEKITMLDLSDNRLTGFVVLGSVIETLDLTNNRLTSLNLNSVHATRLMLSGNAITSVTCTQTNDTVKIIYMPSDTPSDSNKIKDLAFTKNTPNLLSLDVANNAITSIDGLQTLKNLRELYLGGNSVLGNSTQMSLIDNASFCSNLVRLNLGGISTNTSGILSIVKKCTHLEWLQIYGIGASSSQITDAIKQSTHSKLKYLKISHNGFTSVPSGLKYIAKVVIDYYDFNQD